MNFAMASVGAAVIVFSSAIFANAQSTPITVYCTSITENDKSASDGFQLSDAASILRQDRANYHKFGYRDAGDESDDYFYDEGNRARLPAMLANGVTDEGLLRQIVRGTPRICVNVFDGWIDVVPY